jgi:hypothetical protein
VVRQLHGIDAQFDIHVALDLAPSAGVGELFGRLGHHGVAVVIQPVDQRPDRGIFLVLGERGVIQGAHKITARIEQREQTLIVDIESERTCSGIQIRAVDEQRGTFIRGKIHGFNLVNKGCAANPYRV